MSDDSVVSPSVEPEGNRLYQTSFPIRWGDMDALGHVNNTVYLRYFEQARLEWFEQSGYSLDDTEQDAMVIVDNHIEYLKPVVYPMHVTIKMGGHSPGRSTFISTYTLTVGEALFTRGSAKVVWLERRTGVSKPLPASIRQQVASAGSDS